MIVREDQAHPPQELTRDDWAFGDELLVEKYVAGRELTCAVIGDKAYDVIEIRAAGGGWYDYEAKYAPGGSIHVLPANLKGNIYQTIRDLALVAHKALGCRGVSRTDFRYDDLPSGTGDARRPGSQHPARHDRDVPRARNRRLCRHRHSVSLFDGWSKTPPAIGDHGRRRGFAPAPLCLPRGERVAARGAPRAARRRAAQAAAARRSGCFSRRLAGPGTGAVSRDRLFSPPPASMARCAAAITTSFVAAQGAPADRRRQGLRLWHRDDDDHRPRRARRGRNPRRRGDLAAQFAGCSSTPRRSGERLMAIPSSRRRASPSSIPTGC